MVKKPHQNPTYPGVEVGGGRKTLLSWKDLKRKNFTIKIFRHWSYKKVITIPLWTRYRNRRQICCYEKLVKVCVRPGVYTAGAFPGVRSISTPHWMGCTEVYHRVIPQN